MGEMRKDQVRAALGEGRWEMGLYPLGSGELFSPLLQFEVSEERGLFVIDEFRLEYGDCSDRDWRKVVFNEIDAKDGRTRSIKVILKGWSDGMCQDPTCLGCFHHVEDHPECILRRVA